MSHSFFGTDGIRASVGQEPLTPTSLFKLGKAIGFWIQKKKPNAHIIIANDTRHSASLCKTALTLGLLHFPIRLDYAAIAPTPLVHHYVKDHLYDFGIVITASHNPFHDNGIKIVTPDGKITAQDEQIIMTLFKEDTVSFTPESLGTEQSLLTTHAFYQEKVAYYFKKNFLKQYTIVLDTAHGALSSYAQKIFEHFGATVKMIHNEPNGKNINANAGSLFPEHVKNAVLRYGAHAGFAFDGDGDRVIALSSDGTIKDGDDILCFLLKHPRYRSSQAVVGTIISNQGLAHHLEQTHRSLLRTPVGDKYIVEELKQNNLILGGEPSGHIIMRDFSDCPDGLFTALKIAETALLTNDWTMKTFEKFPYVTKNIPVFEKKDLTKEPIVSIIKKNEKTFIGGRLIVRYSGTESILRIVAEGPNKDQAQTTIDALSYDLLPYLTKE